MVKAKYKKRLSVKHLKSHIDNNLNNLIEDYLFDRINKDTLYENLDSISINENVITGIEKFMNSSKSISEDAYMKVCIKIYVKISSLFDNIKKWGGKIVSILTWVLNKMKNFKEKHPIIYKIIVATILIIIFTLVFTLIASAEAGGVKINLKEDFGIDIDTLNTLIGFMDSSNDIDIVRHQAMLIDLKDGVIDGSWGKEEIQKAITQERTILSQSLKNMLSSGHSGTELNILITDLQKAGEKLVGFSREVSKSLDGNTTGEKINIFKKLK